MAMRRRFTPQPQPPIAHEATVQAADAPAAASPIEDVPDTTLSRLSDAEAEFLAQPSDENREAVRQAKIAAINAGHRIRPRP